MMRVFSHEPSEYTFIENMLKTAMQEGQQMLSCGAPGGCLLSYLSKGSTMAKFIFIRRDTRL